MAQTDYRGITIEFDGQTTKLQKRLAEIREEAKYAYSGLRDVNKALKFDDSSVASLTQKQRYLAESIEATRQRQEAMRQGLAALDAEAERNGSLTEKQRAQHDQLERQIEACDRQVKAYREDLARANAAVTEQETALSRLGAALKRTGTLLSDAGSAAAGLGDRMSGSLTLPIVAAGTASVAAATSLDSSFHDLTKTVEGSEAELREFREDAVATSLVKPVEASTTLEVEALGGQLGIASSNLKSFAETVTGLDIATDLDAAQAGTQLAQFVNITGQGQGEISALGSALVDLGNHLATTESATMDMATRLAAAGTQAGMSGADVLGLAAALSSLGLNAEAGGTAVSTVITEIDKAVSAGSEDLALWAAAAGQSAAAFSESWGRDAAGALTSVLSGLQANAAEGSNLSAMLDELGVTSLRQADAMRRLASNSDLLAGAVARSNEAFEANTALAAEVENRNGSLASKLQVLKNRATALAAEVGGPVADALLSMLDAASPLIEAVESGAKAFSEMDEGQQRLVVSTLALVAAAGPALSLLGRVSDGLGGLLAHLGNGITRVKVFGAALSEGFTAAESATLALEGLEGAMLGIGVAAAVVAVGAVASALSDMARREEEVSDATARLRTATDEASSAYASYADGVNTAAASTGNLRERTDELVSSQAELSRSMRETWGDLGADAAAVDAWADRLTELTRKASLTAEEQAELEAAVRGFNEATGESVEVADAASGKLSVTAEALRSMADSYKAASEHEAALSALNELQRQQAENEAALEKATERLADVQQRAGDTYGHSADNIDPYIGAVGAASTEVSQLTALVKANADAQEGLLATIARTSGATDAFSAALARVGELMGGLPDLTEEQAEELRESFDGTEESVLAAIERVFSAAVGAAEGGADAVSEAADAARDAYDSLKEALEDEYDGRKEALDSAYKEEQRAATRAYRQRQKSYDAEYGQLKDALDGEYDALKDGLDERYALLKDGLQDAYDERSEYLSDAYDALKKSIDAELDALKEAHSAQLSELKRSQAAQTKAFKAETEERLSLIDEEYEAQVRLAEEAYGRRSGAVDEQIAALEAEQDAADAAAQAAERAERLAELQEGVDSARSRRKRAEAEKALSDYLNRIAEEDAKAERKRQVDALKDAKAAISEELAARKAALKEERDARVSGTKDARAAELEAVEEAQDSAYAALKASLEAQEKAVKESNEARLAEAKRANAEQLDELKAANDAQLSQLKAAQDLQLANLKDAHASQLADLKDAQSEQLEEMRDAQSDALEGLRDANSRQLAELKDAHAAQLENLKQSRTDQAAVQDGMVGDVSERVARARQALAEGAAPIPADVAGVADRTRQALAQTLQATSEDLGRGGSAAGWNFARALADRRDEASRGAAALRDSALAAAGIGLPDNSLSNPFYLAGYNNSVNYGNGMVAGAGALREAIGATFNTVSRDLTGAGALRSALAPQSVSPGRSLAAQAASLAAETEAAVSAHVDVRPVTLNVTFKDATLRSRSDIRRLTAEIETYVNRTLRGRL